MTKPRPRSWAPVLAVALIGSFASALDAQVRDVVVRMESSGGIYSGNLRTINVALTDSADRATAASAEIGARGIVDLIRGERRSLSLFMSADLRQTTAMGFVTRDYAPTEWGGSTAVEYWSQLGTSVLSASVQLDGRSIWDRPPMPLFLQPGYLRSSGTVQLSRRVPDDVVIDLQLDVQDANYGAPPNFTQLDLLDSREIGVTAGASRDRRSTEGSFLQFYMRFNVSEFRRQQSLENRDPFRRDKTYRGGFLWQRRHGNILYRANLEGIVNRSNSRRPEYNTILAETYVQVPLPGEYSLQALGRLATKNYTHETDFARLVPGEEADSRSEVWLAVGRQVANALDARLQLEWARAETDFSGAYFSSIGLSLALDYRPPW